MSSLSTHVTRSSLYAAMSQYCFPYPPMSHYIFYIHPYHTKSTIFTYIIISLLYSAMSLEVLYIHPCHTNSSIFSHKIFYIHPYITKSLIFTHATCFYIHPCHTQSSILTHVTIMSSLSTHVILSSLYSAMHHSYSTDLSMRPLSFILIYEAIFQ